MGNNKGKRIISMLIDENNSGIKMLKNIFFVGQDKMLEIWIIARFVWCLQHDGSHHYPCAKVTH